MATVRCSLCGELGHNKLAHKRGEPKKCCICGRVLSIDNFSPNRKILTDSVSDEYISSTCKECDKKRCKERYRSNFKNRFGYLLASIKCRCKQKGMLCSITIEDIESIFKKQEGKCSFSGIPLSLETGDNAVSIDRIDPARGYSKDNITLVVWLINNMKRHLSSNQFVNICKVIAEKAA